MINPKDAMPWVGLYVAGATLACILAMTADAFQGFRQWKLWFPNRFFVLNTIYITLIAIAMKLPVDLCITCYLGLDGKVVSIAFLFTMLANFLPSLGLMDDKELLVNMVAWAILMITITLLIRFETEENVYNSNVRSEMKEYAKYVLQIEDDAKLSERISRRANGLKMHQSIPIFLL
ncbi:hypothetical protein Tco_0824261 [Tanacetum coccineum]|uniref:Uncharacterized protein n=1 Tax=Tanacetum coccineum TaxID=301880 RepID=A0ABQ5AMX4_9ASTR